MNIKSSIKLTFVKKDVTAVSLVADTFDSFDYEYARMTSSVEKNQDALKFLTRVDEVTFDAGADPVGALKVLIDRFPAYLVFEANREDVTNDADLKRKQLEKSEAEEKKLKAKLGNEKFIQNAPPEVVEEVKLRLKTEENRVKAFKEEIEKVDQLLEALAQRQENRD